MLFHNHFIHIIVFLLFFINIYAKLSINDNIKTLQKWVSLTNSLVTWHSLSTNNNQNTSIESKIEKSEIINLTDTINNRVKNVTCTYAFFAQRHLEELHTIVENDFLIDEITITVSAIKSSYLKVALKMLKTISDLGYDPPVWMFKIIPFLQNNWSQNDIYVLADLLIILIEFHLAYKCNVPKLQPTERRNINTLLQFDSENEEILTINLIKEMYGLNTMTVDDWLKKYKLPKYITEAYYPNKFWLLEIPEKYSSGSRICGTYLSAQLRQIAGNVQNNILDSYYILDKNKSIVPIKNYGDFRQPRFLKPLNKKEIPMIVPSKIQESPVGFQIYEFKYRVNYLVFNTFWYPQGMDKLVEKNKQITYINQRTNLNMPYCSKLKNSKNSIMDKLHMLYLHYALVHLDQALLFLQYIKLIPGKKKNYGYSQHLIQLYYDISMMTIATFINQNYYPAEWMVHLVLYCMEESSDIEQTEDFDKKIILSISKISIIITMLEEVNSKINPKKLNPPKFDIKGIQFDDSNTANKLYVNLLREYKLFKIQDYPLMPYIDILYSNLIEVAYLLEINSKHLPYDDYDKYTPSKWLFREWQIRKSKVNTFRLIEVEKFFPLYIVPVPVEDRFWEKFRKNFMTSYRENIKKRQNFSNDSINMIDTSKIVHRYIINLIQTHLIKSILIILLHCYKLNDLYFKQQSQNQKDVEGYLKSYNDACGFSSELMDSMQRLILHNGLSKDTVFIKLQEEIKLFPIIYNSGTNKYNISPIESHKITSFTKTSKLGMKKLNAISISMGMDDFDPILPGSTQNLTIGYQYDIPYITRAKSYMADLNLIIKASFEFNTNFSTHNQLMKSNGHYRPRRISLGYIRGNTIV